MTYTEVVWKWTGFAGQPGYSKFRFEGTLDSAGASSAADHVKTFLNSCSLHIPSSVVITPAATAQVYETDGTLSAEVAITPAVTAVAGLAAGVYSAPSGVAVNWLTGVIHGGHKVRGRTFIVPLSGSAYDATDGSIGTTPIGQLRTAATTLVGTTPKMVIVSHKVIGAVTSHVAAVVQAAQINDKAAILRSRRD